MPARARESHLCMQAFAPLALVAEPAQNQEGECVAETVDTRKRSQCQCENANVCIAVSQTQGKQNALEDAVIVVETTMGSKKKLLALARSPHSLAFSFTP